MKLDTLFDPLIAQWFASHVGQPTDIQQRAWPEIAAGRHVLLTAPTGSGKTLTAFLYAINQLATGVWEGGHTRVLYVSPLKALNNDIQRNLLTPLAQLRAVFQEAGCPMPAIQVLTRSGDTSQTDRRRMLRHPPEILITTPESLNLLLASPNARALLMRLETVILDEIHAIAGTKRGTHLITAVDRIVPLSGEFQRIALSATVRPLETIAEFVGGFEMLRHGETIEYRPRPVRIVQSPQSKRIALQVRAADADRSPGEAPWEGVTSALKEIIARNRSTLIFANSRRLCERLSLMLNDNEPQLLAYAHHGSLSRETRAVVEQRLKDGELRAIVATNSLELGIDIGALDEVALVQTPPSVASALQRIGRAGHQVNAVSRGTLFPIHGRDYLDAAVMAKAVSDLDIEPLKPVSGALDVLAQIITAMVAVEPWQLDDLHAFLRTTWPYRDLSRKHFELVVEMLAGRYEETRIRELQPVVRVDRIDGTISGQPGALKALYLSGGTIADRGYYSLRLKDSRAKIGELDEEFVWERSVGDAFTMGSQAWMIQEITHNDVLVTPAPRRAAFAPFWRSDERSRSAHFSQRLAEFLEYADAHLDRAAFRQELETAYCLDAAAATELLSLLQRQVKATGARLPHRHHLVIEFVTDYLHHAESEQAVLHTLWGGGMNRPYAMALTQAWEERYQQHLEIFANDDSLAIMLPRAMSAQDLIGLVTSDNLDRFLRARLEQTGFFGARFREAAGIALQLPRQQFNRRMPLWMTRLRSKKLLSTIMRYDDFPVLVEAWRSCLQDEFELDLLRERLAALQAGRIPISEVRCAFPSPFADAMVWRQTNLYMYQGDSPNAPQTSRLREDVLAEIVHQGDLRPRIPRALARQFEQKLQRLWPGYAPSTPEDVLEWLKERLLLPEAEWGALLDAVQRDGGLEEEGIVASVGAKICCIAWGRGHSFVAALETLPRLNRAFGMPPEEATLLTGDAVEVSEARQPEDEEDTFTPLLAEWLRFYGPRPVEELFNTLPVSEEVLRKSLEDLVESRSVIVDTLLEEDNDDGCQSQAGGGGGGAGVACGCGSTPSTEGLDPELDTQAQQPQAPPPPSPPPDACDCHPIDCHPIEAFDAEGCQSQAGGGGGGAGVACGCASTPSTEELDPELNTQALQPQAAPPPPPPPDACDCHPIQACDTDNLEILLRLLRVATRPSFVPLALLHLQLFLAHWQGLTTQQPRPLEDALESLLAYPMSAGLIEAEVLPARGHHGTSELDRLLEESDLIWFGCGPRQIALGFPEHLALRDAPEAEALQGAADLLPDLHARYTFADLLLRTGRSSAALADELWRLAWVGAVSTDSFAPVRKGVQTRFKAKGLAQELPASRSGRALRRGFNRWKAERPFAGAWQRLESVMPPDDPIERQEWDRENVRLLLDRYGILFRELLDQELPALRWGALFRTLRLMELSGELVAGAFFEGILGLQFMSPAAFQSLQQGLPEDAVYWLNAADPVSLCGLGVEELRGNLPKRQAGTWIVWQGAAMALVVTRQGKQLDFRLAPDAPGTKDALTVFDHLLQRPGHSYITVETINGVSAEKSPYAQLLRERFETTLEVKGLTLWRSKKPVQ
jgi:ATP-dependent Lhr-like helicase